MLHTPIPLKLKQPQIPTHPLPPCDLGTTKQLPYFSDLNLLTKTLLFLFITSFITEYYLLQLFQGPANSLLTPP